MISSGLFWDKIIPTLNHGLLFSLSLIIPSAILGIIGGTLVGVLRVFAPSFIRRIADGYVALFRGVPLLLQLYFLYYSLPEWIGVYFSAYQAAIIGFVLCSAAYHSEYIRGALLSIRKGQIQAAYSLGFTTRDMVLFIAIPQALRRALPGCGNEIIYLIKYSSLAYMLTYIELTGSAKSLAQTTFFHTEIYFLTGLYYLSMTTLAAWALRWCERKVYVPGFGLKK